MSKILSVEPQIRLIRETLNMACDGRDEMCNGSLWLRRVHLPGVAEAPGSMPSMTIKIKKKDKRLLGRKGAL